MAQLTEVKLQPEGRAVELDWKDSVRAALRRWDDAYRVIVTNAGSLMGTTLVTSGLGFIYWWAAARLYPPEAVGFANAAVSAMLLLSSIGALGFGTLLVGELPRPTTAKGSLIITASLAVGLASGLLAVGFALVTPWISPDLRALADSSQGMILFTVSVSLFAVTYVLDQAIIGLLRGGLQLWRNTLFAAVKLGLVVAVGLWLPGSKTGLVVYGTWLVGMVVSLAPLVRVALRRRAPLRDYWPQVRLLRRLGKTTLAHHALNLALQYPTPMFPLVVAALLSLQATAYFYAAWMIANFAFAGLTAFATVLYAVGSAAPSVLAQKMRMTLGSSVLMGVLANLVLWVCGDFILGLFGPAYAQQGGWSLRLLGLVIFPLIVRGHYTTLCRIHGRLLNLTVFMVIADVLELSLAVLGAKFGGLSGLCLGWLIAVSLEAVIMFPAVYRAVWRPASLAPARVSQAG